MRDSAETSERPSDSGPRLRVVSYNVHACIGADGRFSPPRIARVLESLEADFIGIQELEDRQFNGESVSDYLARKLGMHAHRGATLMRGDSHYGNLLLSRLPAQAIRLHDISVPGREPRGIVDAEFHLVGRRVRVLVTHFGLKAKERRKQVDDLVEVFESRRADVTILAGDVNEWRPMTYARRTLDRAFGRGPGLATWPARRPLLALDLIGVSPAACRVAQRVVATETTRQASDHLPLLCEVERQAPGTES